MNVKEEVRKRDGYHCVDCGMTNEEHMAFYNKKLEVHRIVPGSMYSLEPGVCMTLCRECHWERHREAGTAGGSKAKKSMKKEINPDFGAKLKAAREAGGLSQVALAEKCGVPFGTLREYEQGRREPLFSAMQKIAAGLGMSLDGWPSPLVDND